MREAAEVPLLTFGAVFAERPVGPLAISLLWALTGGTEEVHTGFVADPSVASSLSFPLAATFACAFSFAAGFHASVPASLRQVAVIPLPRAFAFSFAVRPVLAFPVSRSPFASPVRVGFASPFRDGVTLSDAVVSLRTFRCLVVAAADKALHCHCRWDNGSVMLFQQDCCTSVSSATDFASCFP